MAISDVYLARSGSVNNTVTTALALVSLYGTAAKRVWVVGVRVEIGVTAAAAGNSILFQLARPNATNTGTGLATGNAHDYTAQAIGSIGQQAVAWSTTPTVGVILWEQELPQTTGSAWEEFPPLGYEWGVPAIANANANAGVHVFSTASVNTTTPVFADIVWSE
jgi:hypothetical protein